MAAKKGLLGESSFQRLNLAILAASAFNTVLFVSNSATAGGYFAFVTASPSYHLVSLCAGTHLPMSTAYARVPFHICSCFALQPTVLRLAVSGTQAFSFVWIVQYCILPRVLTTGLMLPCQTLFSTSCIHVRFVILHAQSAFLVCLLTHKRFVCNCPIRACTPEISNFGFCCCHEVLTALLFNMLGKSSVVLSGFAPSTSTSVPMNDNQIAFQCCRRKL